MSWAAQRHQQAPANRSRRRHGVQYQAGRVQPILAAKLQRRFHYQAIPVRLSFPLQSEMQLRSECVGRDSRLRDVQHWWNAC